MQEDDPRVPSGASLSRTQKRRALLTLALGLAVMTVVFVGILPQVIDYEAVWETLTSLSPASLATLLLAGLLYPVPEGGNYAATVPGLSWWRGIKAWLASDGVGKTVPGLDFVTRFGMYRSWGCTGAEATRGMFLSGAIDWSVKFAMPAVAAVLLVIAGVTDLGYVAVFAAIGSVAAVLILGPIIVAVRSERATSWLAARGEALSAWGLRRLKRAPVADVGARIVEFRNDTAEVAGKRIWRAAAASAAGKLWQFVILLLALRAVGVPADVVGWDELFIVFALVILITMIPLTPGGIGIAEFFYIAFLSEIAGKEWASILAAGVMLYRVFQWALPIPIGWTVTLRWRRQVQRGDLPDPFAPGDVGPARSEVSGQDLGSGDAG
ncbi:lysylphosphatidylglycerol synthase domain-containing protein [Nocardioides sp. YIM 152588]|uniref:lysylphosphatidylglycerol synthase transmembrane domain-containing protein n=1 Tax=Nocardioides sp. YIM 152588 TaxID=3158259 RepID=UPI0032E51337